MGDKSVIKSGSQIVGLFDNYKTVVMGPASHNDPVSLTQEHQCDSTTEIFQRICHINKLKGRKTHTSV